MSTYETSATVQEQGQVLVPGVPFAPGTEVEVVISAKLHSEQPATTPPTGIPAAGLRWEGNVLVHQGVGAAPSVAELREDRLNRLGEAQAG